MAGLRLQGIEKSYGAVHAVHGIDLDIAEGGIRGPRRPLGLRQVHPAALHRGAGGSGRGHHHHRRRGGERHAATRRNLAMVFQNYALYPYMNVRENIAFGLKARRVPKAEIEVRVRRAADMLGIGTLLDRLPRQLSGGQAPARGDRPRHRARCAPLPLRRAALQPRRPAPRRDATEIKRLHQELGKTMVYVTHDQIEAMTLADRIVLLREGVIEQEGAPLDLFERPVSKFVARFLGSPPNQLHPARLDRDGSGLALRCGEGTVFALPPERAGALESHAGRDVILGVRPEHITGSSHAGGRREHLVSHQVTIDLVQPPPPALRRLALAGAEVLAEPASPRRGTPGRDHRGAVRHAAGDPDRSGDGKSALRACAGRNTHGREVPFSVSFHVRECLEMRHFQRGSSQITKLG